MSQGHTRQDTPSKKKTPYWYKVIIKSISGTFPPESCFLSFKVSFCAAGTMIDRIRLTEF